MLYVHFCHISTYKKYTKHKKTTKVQCHVWITLFIYDGCSNADRRCLKTFDYPLKITITRWRVCWRFMPKQKQLSAINKHCHAKFNSSGPFTRLGSAWTDEPFPTDFRHSRRRMDQVFPRIRWLTRLLPVSRLPIRSILDFHPTCAICS